MLALALIAAASTPQAGVVTIAAFERRGVHAVVARGVSDPRTGRAATIDDPARIASVSKLTVAMTVLALKLDLDRDVSDWLGWPLRHPDFPDAKITLRLLLSHQSSLTDAADYALPLGETVRERLTRPGAWDHAHKPGSYFRYSNLNFPVIASVVEAATGERFDRVMTRVLFRPAQIDAGFNWQGASAAAIGRAVVLRAPDGTVIRDDLQGQPPPCPVVPDAQGGCDLSNYRPGENGALFSPQGVLRISAHELAKLGQLIASPARLRKLGVDTRTLATPLWRFDGANGDTEKGFYCAYGLAVQFLNEVRRPDCRDDLFGDGRKRFGHAGEAYGLRSGLWIDPKTGKGRAFFATGLGETQAPGRTAFTAAEEEMARER